MENIKHASECTSCARQIGRSQRRWVYGGVRAAVGGGKEAEKTEEQERGAGREGTAWPQLETRPEDQPSITRDT